MNRVYSFVESYLSMQFSFARRVVASGQFWILLPIYNFYGIRSCTRGKDRVRVSSSEIIDSNNNLKNVRVIFIEFACTKIEYFFILYELRKLETSKVQNWHIIIISFEILSFNVSTLFQLITLNFSQGIIDCQENIKPWSVPRYPLTRVKYRWSLRHFSPFNN